MKQLAIATVLVAFLVACNQNKTQTINTENKVSTQKESIADFENSIEKQYIELRDAPYSDSTQTIEDAFKERFIAYLKAEPKTFKELKFESNISTPFSTVTAPDGSIKIYSWYLESIKGSVQIVQFSKNNVVLKDGLGINCYKIELLQQEAKKLYLFFGSENSGTNISEDVLVASLQDNQIMQEKVFFEDGKSYSKMGTWYVYGTGTKPRKGESGSYSYFDKETQMLYIPETKFIDNDKAQPYLTGKYDSYVFSNGKFVKQ